MTSLSMSTVRYDIYYTVVCMLYVVWLVYSSHMVIMTFYYISPALLIVRYAIHYDLFL